MSSNHHHILDVDVAGQLECGHDEVDEVGFAVVAGWVGASHVEERAVDEFSVRCRVTCAWGEACQVSIMHHIQFSR